MKKVVPKPARAGAARKSSPTYLKSNFKIGDRVLIIDIPEDLKDPKSDLKSPDAREMRTGELFRFCLGRVFTVYGFGRYGHVELEVSKSLTVGKKFGLSTVWMEPEFLKLVKRKATLKGTRG